jgi:uncharacterized SAM-binding protein YcdF (DUF218 family)
MELWPRVASHLLTPPGIVLIAALLGYLVKIRWRWLGNFFVGASVVALLVFSVPLATKRMVAPLESQYPPLPALTHDAALKLADAIVVLGGGRYAGAPEYGADTVNDYTLERLRYTARLAKETGLPVLVSGGHPFSDDAPEAELMRDTLEKDFDVKVRWLEDRSNNTLENARNSADILRDAGVRRIFLVTHAWHMPRAMWAFSTTGINATAAPMGFTTFTSMERNFLGYLPSARGLELGNLALHERIGLFWYRSRDQADAALTPDSAPTAAPK